MENILLHEYETEHKNLHEYLGENDAESDIDDEYDY